MGASASVQETAEALEAIGRPYQAYADKVREYDVGVKDLLATEGGLDKIWDELDLPPRNLEKARLKRELAQLEKQASSPGEELRPPQTIDNLKEDEARPGEEVTAHNEAKYEAVEEVAHVDAHPKSDLTEIERLVLEAAKIEATPVPTKQNVLEESYHVFIGYRVATEEIFTTALYDKLIMTSVVDKILMPPNNAIVKPYLDKKVLKDGEPWADGFAAGLANSRVFCPVMSVWDDHKGSVGGLMNLKPSEGRDWVDNVLLEYEFALQVQKHRPDFLRIMPILMGPPDGRGYTEFPFSLVNELPQEVSIETKKSLLHYCTIHGIPLSQGDLQRNIRATVLALTTNQGKQMWKLGAVDLANAQVAKDIMDKCIEAMSAIKVNDLSTVRRHVEVTLGGSVQTMMDAGSPFIEIWGAGGHSFKDIRKAGCKEELEPKVEQLIKAVERYGIDAIHAASGQPFLIYAILEDDLCDVSVLKALLARGADKEVQSPKNKLRPLAYAALHRPSLIDYLVNDIMAEIDAVNDDGRSALADVCLRGTLDIVKQLIELGADDEITDTAGKSVLHYAVTGRNYDTAIWLMEERGADVLATDQSGETIKDFAIKNYTKGFLVYLKDIKKLEGLESVDVRKGASCLSLSHSACVNTACFSSDGKLLATASTDKTARLWDVSSGECVATLTGHSREVNTACFSSDGKLLATASHDKTARLWDVSSGECVATLTGHSSVVNTACFSSDGKLLATGSYDNTARLWDVSSGECVATLTGHSDWVKTACFSSDGKLLATASNDETARLWDVSSGECVATLTGHSSVVNTACFSSDGKLLATGSYDNTARLWDVSSGECVATLTGHSDWVRTACFSSDGKLLATASHDKTARLWDVSSGECVATLTGHSNMVRTVCFSSDGKLLATTTYGKTARLWDVSSGECVATLTGHSSGVNTACFSSDGKLLATASDDNTARLWEIREIGLGTAGFESEEEEEEDFGEEY